jgi:hypothetical protein
MHIKFCLGSVKGRDHLEDLGVDSRIILKWILGKIWLEDVDYIIWLRIGTGCGPL